ncbi:MAG: DUF2652 domain-containing protein [Bacteroidales bacterium]|nr:DUF2652 domain-containing protein [Bacteroidales bacterium]
MNPSNSTFLFIPDISGFTEFVNKTKIDHSKHIITELLEIIINSDQLGLTVSEIEGDAVLFYRENVPDLQDIITIYTFERKAGETLLKVDMDFKVSSFIGKIFKPLIRKVLKKQTKKGLEILKTISEKV